MSDNSVDVEATAPTNDDVYGGIFDMDHGAAAPLDKSQLNSALLFFDRIFVPDGFFHCYGPLSSALIKEIKAGDQDEIRGEIISYLRCGLIVPVIRYNEETKNDRKHPSDVWFGNEPSVRPGTYQILSKDSGDFMFSALRQVRIPQFTHWSPEMTPGNPAFVGHNSFAQTLYYHLCENNFGLPDEKNIQEALRYLPEINTSRGEIAKVIDISIQFADFISKNQNDSGFRRGNVENFFSQYFSEQFKFSYDSIWSMSGFLGAHVQSIFRAVGSCYQLHQAGGFGLNLQSGKKSDIVIDKNQNNLLPVRSNLINISIEIMNDIDLSKLTAHDIVKIRKESPEISHQLKIKQKNLRYNTVGDDEANALIDFASFVQSKYVPHILHHCPHAKNLPRSAAFQTGAERANVVNSAVNLITAAGGAIIGDVVVSLSVGGNGIFFNTISIEGQWPRALQAVVGGTITVAGLTLNVIDVAKPWIINRVMRVDGNENEKRRIAIIDKITKEIRTKT